MDKFYQMRLQKLILATGILLGISSSAYASSEQTKNTLRIGHATISNVTINGKNGTLSVNAGAKLKVKLDFTSDSSRRCPKCQNQIIVSYARQNGSRLERVPGGRCIYSSDGRHSKRDYSFQIDAPAAPGRYRMIVMATQAYNCTRALQYQPRLRPIAALQVR